MDGSDKMVYSILGNLTNTYLLNIQSHVIAKIVMVDPSVDEWKLHVQNLVPVVTPTATAVRREFIVLLL